MAYVTIGASQVRKALNNLSPEGGRVLLRSLAPELPAEIIDLMVKHAGEVGVSGSRLSYPDSWNTIVGLKK